MAVQTNLTKMFYSIIDRAIPKNHPYLCKLFNKNNLKIGYACTRNMGAIISSHNSRIQRQDGQVENDKPCNCRVKANCPLNGHCLIKSIVYRAEISTNEQKDTRFYIGSCSSTFKERFSNHLKSIRHERYGKETTLSSYFWRLKAKGKDPTIKWSILKRAPSYHPSIKKCRLCLAEKILILENVGDERCLNSRRETFSKCRHRNKWTLGAIT